ncbi:hypothetical protein L1887_05009 [Cichorium endivia]|nr:hypothetical protein L1887_05009 [Cichorium endivia]
MRYSLFESEVAQLCLGLRWTKWVTGKGQDSSSQTTITPSNHSSFSLSSEPQPCGTLYHFVDSIVHTFFTLLFCRTYNRKNDEGKP